MGDAPAHAYGRPVQETITILPPLTGIFVLSL
jgi:hypothetical protein